MEERTSSLLNALAPCRALKHRQKFCQYCQGTFSPPTPFMLEFTRGGASGGPKAIVWTENEKNRVPKSPSLQKLMDFQFGVSNICHK